MKKIYLTLIGSEIEQLTGGFHIGGFEATNRDLREVLGKSRRYSNDKSTVSYRLMLEDGTIIEIYDYKQQAYRNPDELIYWHISGYDEKDGKRVELFFKQLLLEKEIKELKENQSDDT